MRTWLTSLLTLAAFLGLAPAAHAHVGDEIYPFFELLDEDLDRIDLTDGSVEDWLEVVGEPSLTALDFFWGYDGLSEYDPSELDFRIWLAWNQGSSTLWIAMERFDDLYFNLYDGDEPWKMHWWDSSIRFMVDGDHTGGGYSYLRMFNCHECSDEEVREDNRQAQEWVAIAETPNDEDASEASQLYPGKTIGFQITTSDNDDTQWKDGSGRLEAIIDADFFVDGLLIGAGEDPFVYDDRSAVEPSSWGRIKGID